MERAAVYLTAPWPLTAGTPRRAPQCGLPAQNRCCCRGAFLFSALTSEACRARLSSLACQARHAHLFPVFPGYLRPHGSCSSGRAWQPRLSRPGEWGPQHGDGSDGELCGLPRWADWHPVPGSCWEVTGLEAFLKGQPPSLGEVCALLDSWEPFALRTELSRLASS